MFNVHKPQNLKAQEKRIFLKFDVIAGYIHNQSLLLSVLVTCRLYVSLGHTPIGCPCAACEHRSMFFVTSNHASLLL